MASAATAISFVSSNDDLRDIAAKTVGITSIVSLLFRAAAREQS